MPLILEIRTNINQFSFYIEIDIIFQFIELKKMIINYEIEKSDTI